MHTMKRFFATLLVFLMAISMVACGDKPATTPSTTPSTTPDADSYHAKYGLPDVDFSGKTLEIIDGTGWASKASLEGDHNQIARFEMFQQFEEETGATIVASESSYTTLITEAQSYTMSGDKYGDIWLDMGWTLGQFYTSDLLKPMNDLKYLDTTKDYWHPSILETFTINGNLYGVSGDIAPIDNLSFMLFYNKSVAEELQLPDLYQLVRDGDWTFDKFIEYCEKAMKDNGDNVWTAEDRYGLGGPPSTIEQELFYSMGGYFYNIDENGKYYCATIDAHNTKIIDLITANVRDNHLSYDLSGGETWEVNTKEMFPTDRLLFCCYAASGLELWKEMTSDFGLLPMPKLNKEQKEYRNGGTQAVFTIFIGKNADQLDLTGYFLEFCGAYADDVLQTVSDTHYETLFRDEDSLEMLHLAFGNPYFERVTVMLANTAEYSVLFNTAQAAFNYTMATPGASITSLYEASIEAVNLKLAELFGY